MLVVVWLCWLKWLVWFSWVGFCVMLIISVFWLLRVGRCCVRCEVRL